jgi:hypothetical protein
VTVAPRHRLPSVLGVLLCASACIAELEPEVGELRTGVCEPEDTDPGHDVSFMNDVLPLLDRPGSEGGCSCHMPTSMRPFAIELTGLDLGSPQTIRRGGKTSGSENVVPGDPCASILLQKVGPAPPFGARMPQGGPPYLTPGERDLIADWVAEGARDN